MNPSTSDSDRSEEASESAGIDWPDGTQDAMQLGPDWRAHAIPMWATHNFLGVAYSFEVAAEAVHEKLGEQSPDVLYMPLQYLWRHNIELLLKANIQIWSRLEGEVAGLALEDSTSTVCRSVLTPPGPGGHPSVGGS